MRGESPLRERLAHAELGVEHLVGDAAELRVEVAAEDVAQDGAQVAAEVGDQRLDLGLRADVAGDRGALEPDRLVEPALERRALLAAWRR